HGATAARRRRPGPMRRAAAGLSRRGRADRPGRPADGLDRLLPPSASPQRPAAPVAPPGRPLARRADGRDPGREAGRTEQAEAAGPTVADAIGEDARLRIVPPGLNRG